MSIGPAPLLAAQMPLMHEHEAARVLAGMPAPYRVPADWTGPDDDVLVFTHDPLLAVLVADVVARHELGGSYPCVAGGGVAVDGPTEVVLVGAPGTEFVDWRPAAPGDGYALLACLVHPARRRGVAR